MRGKALDLAAHRHSQREGSLRTQAETSQTSSERTPKSQAYRKTIGDVIVLKLSCQAENNQIISACSFYRGRKLSKL
eukprot:978171-Amphidinium_carterae.1